MSGGSSSGAAGQAQELRHLSDLSPPAASSSGPPSVTIESETGARRPRPRARGRADPPAPPPATSSAEAARDKHAFKEPADVKRMEADLLRLMQGFNSGSLRAFGKDVSMEQMEQIREQQERLAKLHFEMGAQQELFPPLSEEGLSRASASLQQLMQQLQQLSSSIEKLHSRADAPAAGPASTPQEPPHGAST
ncbi:coiled-coil domain-containing protein 28B-like isoform X2 [Amphibalanus amphitrite]|uniref:coiled-coil domain-containing protein 28B-like isoform X2 n=1 Tax=Amphibalanus amphitrite TaxID=1232801 RepID=UPI001C919C16|nr:coiled-coil domain-containing protein 28B-like isoform X2 [Amphibalanus amphitrite]XP_043215143.1 coiled-coil domain-containing protein 28B-like isoform X2 [Amphibalanus amphitrite]XP_043215144.1 coiled-coil domain-containing protein 28B-like isoform X2 [Amphibalanus amphitrite]XP_043215145.1 coiled-coil domain-containing protein 28B-like isoform X2 [Amphibalanus amphitrite]XP_043215146.1 coiled-coil domain-containing protein 28B-like isoform X2 [Amphibalanus amphitrite]XP_043215148.1 coile